jgi:hypothetical protein
MVLHVVVDQRPGEAAAGLDRDRSPGRELHLQDRLVDTERRPQALQPGQRVGHVFGPEPRALERVVVDAQRHDGHARRDLGEPALDAGGPGLDVEHAPAVLPEGESELLAAREADVPVVDGQDHDIRPSVRCAGANVRRHRRP